MIKSKTDLARYFAKLGFKTGAEIGVAEGRFSEILCQEVPDLKLFCVDSWKPHPDNRKRLSQAHCEKKFKEAKKRLIPYGATIVRSLSMDAVQLFADESLDFVFIDANHAFKYVMDDLTHWSPKVRKGGVVSGHDYYKMRGGGVVEAVNAYTKAHQIKINLTQPTKDNDFDDREPCYYWIKK